MQPFSRLWDRTGLAWNACRPSFSETPKIMKASHRILRSSLALTAVGVGGSTQAEIVWSGPVDLWATVGNPVYFDVNGDAVNDYRLLFAADNTSKPSLTSAIENDLSKLVLVDTNGVTDEGAYGFPVTSTGTTIDSTYLNGGSNWEGFFYMNGDNQLAGGYYNDGAGDTGYVGLAIPGVNGNNYGWAQVSFIPSSNLLILHDYAYETEAGVGIVTGAVPEPSSIALLAAGAGGLALLRAGRKRA